MLSLSRSSGRRPRLSSIILHHQFLSPRPLCYPLRTNATSQPRRTESPRSQPSISSKPRVYTPPVFPSSSNVSSITRPKCIQPPVPLQSVGLKTLGAVGDYPSAINPPSSTRPPPLILPEREPDLPEWKYLFRLGKGYATFYKTGLKAIWKNYKASRALGYSNSPPPTIYNAVRAGALTRAQFQLIKRVKSDTNKLPLFILLWVVCGELTPLLVIFVTGLVPRTIWIPKQVEKVRNQAEERRRIAKETYQLQLPGPISGTKQFDGMQPQSRAQIYKLIAQSYNLYPVWWDKYIPSLIPGALIRNRVRRRISEIYVDDVAIMRDGGVGMMDAQEIDRACEERGLDVLGREEEDLRWDLGQWLEQRKELKRENVNFTGVKESKAEKEK